MNSSEEAMVGHFTFYDLSRFRSLIVGLCEKRNNLNFYRVHFYIANGCHCWGNPISDCLDLWNCQWVLSIYSKTYYLAACLEVYIPNKFVPRLSH